MPETGRRPTIKDVARAAGVSLQTVSRAINGKAEIDPSTRQRVLDIVQQMGYRRSRHARGLAAPGVDTLGLIVPDLINPFFPSLIQGVIDAASAQGWRVVVSTSDGDPEGEQRLIRSMSEQVDSLVGYFDHSRAPTPPLPPDLRLVLLDPEKAVPGAGSVRIDVPGGVDAAVAHLAERGYRRPGMIDCTTTCDRFLRGRSFLASAAARGLDMGRDRIELAEQSIAGGETAIHALLERHPEVDAVFAFNDLVAVGALRGLAARGLRVPQDCAVIGFDGSVLGGLVTPTLTSVHVDTHRLGLLAVDEVRRLIDDQSSSDTDPVTLDCELLVRDST
ncbi:MULTISPECIES: LacI family DNA-binding transcriptional regulator [unclassified Pseudonocardia]|uniref:LacI family DNA-binding transcriptional regulator n=1 Tax=unclassified Pseudonocardia TaxID=2619320 RepID=UPI0001FFEEB8|nr:LacI family DNA-binding transcriptional regulator [Pseudonocardia sp. Ae707_Ps1]OLM18317.1 Ribose operon repressor [Pseudonocardia sp. Ae707_Ps1]